ncbi:MAG: phosphatase PAP2 family protein [Chthoniobacterales bacterium]|nr:phosphatase PAP2 family protein [Chthoniobacterales bacterium]
MTTAILVAGIFFLIIPLRYGFARTHAEGWSSALFAWFLTMDAPFNLFPSLHAALWLLLLDVYARQLRGLVRLIVLAWFALIGASPLLTHQHHVIDIAGGLALGAACLFDWSRFASPAHDRPQEP